MAGGGYFFLALVFLVALTVAVFLAGAVFFTGAGVALYALYSVIIHADAITAATAAISPSINPSEKYRNRIMVTTNTIV